MPFYVSVGAENDCAAGSMDQTTHKEHIDLGQGLNFVALALAGRESRASARALLG
jgi:hypothetical protein